MFDLLQAETIPASHSIQKSLQQYGSAIVQFFKDMKVRRFQQQVKRRKAMTPAKQEALLFRRMGLEGREECPQARKRVEDVPRG